MFSNEKTICIGINFPYADIFRDVYASTFLTSTVSLCLTTFVKNNKAKAGKTTLKIHVHFWEMKGC